MAKKSLSQNFLKSKKILEKMCEIGSVNNKDIILEIGPGKGSLTEKLLERANKVVAIEKDRELVKLLKKKFTKEIKNKKLKIIEGDCLKFNPDVQTGFGHFGQMGWFQYKIIANIPYNITGAILKKFLSLNNQPEQMVLLVQKEVAERIVGKKMSIPGLDTVQTGYGQFGQGKGKESILSLSVKAYGLPKYIIKVNKKLFSPSPKVDSAIISINNISKKNFINKKEEKLFFDIIKIGFAHKRKILKRNLENLDVLSIPMSDMRINSRVRHRNCGNYRKGKIDEIFNFLKINKNIRAEDVPLSLWLEITHLLSTKN